MKVASAVLSGAVLAAVAGCTVYEAQPWYLPTPVADATPETVPLPPYYLPAPQTTLAPIDLTPDLQAFPYIPDTPAEDVAVSDSIYIPAPVGGYGFAMETVYAPVCPQPIIYAPPPQIIVQQEFIPIYQPALIVVQDNDDRRRGDHRPPTTRPGGGGRGGDRGGPRGGDRGGPRGGMAPPPQLGTRITSPTPPPGVGSPAAPVAGVPGTPPGSRITGVTPVAGRPLPRDARDISRPAPFRPPALPVPPNPGIVRTPRAIPGPAPAVDTSSPSVRAVIPGPQVNRAVFAPPPPAATVFRAPMSMGTPAAPSFGYSPPAAPTVYSPPTPTRMQSVQPPPNDPGAAARPPAMRGRGNN